MTEPQGRTRRQLVFIDAEYTGEHAYTTLVSLGLVALDGGSLYLTLNDYDQGQVTDWLRENVIATIDPAQATDSPAAFRRLDAWLREVADGGRICLVSAGLGSDLLLLFELYRHARPDLKYFHALHCLPDYLNHTEHFDLNTLLFVAGEDPGMDRDRFIDHAVEGRRHDALHDARLARACFLKIMKHDALARFVPFVEPRAYER